MSELKSDDEKAEELKEWWKNNGTSVMAGVGLAIAALFGWEYWKGYQVDTAEAAAALYSEGQSNTDPAQSSQILQQVREDYSSTPYAAMAALQSAKKLAEEGKYNEAGAALQWVVDNSDDAEYQDVARLRLARVLLAEKKPDAALKLTQQDFAAAYESLLEELRGDIFAAQNKPDEARKAYDRAILTSKGGSTEFIQMKKDNLGSGS